MADVNSWHRLICVEALVVIYDEPGHRWVHSTATHAPSEVIVSRHVTVASGSDGGDALFLRVLGRTINNNEVVLLLL